MQTMQRTCPACHAATAPEDRFCGECGREIAEKQPSAAPVTAPLALAAAVRLRPERIETPGTLLAERGELLFFSKDVSATLLVPLRDVRQCLLTHVGPLDALTFGAQSGSECFVLKDGTEFFEALSEMLARKDSSDATPRLLELSAKFASRAREIVAESFSIGEQLKSPMAAKSFMRLIDLVTAPPAEE